MKKFEEDDPMIYWWADNSGHYKETESLDDALLVLNHGCPVLAIEEETLRVCVEKGLDHIPYVQELHSDGSFSNAQVSVSLGIQKKTENF